MVIGFNTTQKYSFEPTNKVSLKAVIHNQLLIQLTNWGYDFK